ncbi:methylmalonyl-CoA mutase family protein [Actinosynnema pretiosum]|uniref:Methylmalonyl-CoA mutase n=1 Tax=Actinosynnema pretiosum TaxID=42197 RepID=A0A290ZE28_9PSEU|nr:methylmalonyl-CoA mutase family protein [Actinosynnema pretiosum]ATE57266.1 methylmalonyl-CoA mutase [Actinosynnema pretiosum]
MIEQPGELALAAEFPEPDRERWLGLVEGVLGKTGAEYDSLVTTTYDGIAVQPLHTADEPLPATGLPGTFPFTRGGRPQGTALGWEIRQQHREADREAVVADLENGVGALWLRGIAAADLEPLLAEVYLDLAPVVLDAGADFAASGRELLRIWGERSAPGSELAGNLGADPLGALAATGQEPDTAALLDLLPRLDPFPAARLIAVDALPHHNAGGSDAQELGASLAAGVAYLRLLTDAGLPVARAARLLEFRYAATADQFLTTAKLRAARRLWARVTEVCGEPTPQVQHAVTSPAMMTRRDPWVNMLRTTIACAGAGMGGADAITVLPFDHAIGLPDDFSRRIARNTQSVLLEESRLSAVIDPAGGSWYVERLTEDLARAAWRWFQEIEAEGGLAAALRSGLVADRLAATWERRRANLADRTDAITGVSEFPNLGEKPVVRRPAPSEPGGGLPVIRYAQDFEALRDRADAAPERPRVFLATLGPVAAHTARATFAANLLQAGGVETPQAGPTRTTDDVVAAFRASGARVACLCGSESSYAELAAPTADALRAAGAERVLLAGKRSDATVDDHLFLGCPALDVLGRTFESLGVPR